MTRRQRRIVFLVSALGLATLATVLVISALGDRVLYFYSPADAKERKLAVGQAVNLGGLVEKGSIERPGGVEVRFKITDGQEKVTVTYSQDLPDLFREGQGVIATGAFRPDGIFEATSVLAKHDEKYMPPEVAKMLKERGVWKEGEPLP
jgi:cytochrome c-type biogenesis protein CcmE